MPQRKVPDDEQAEDRRVVLEVLRVVLTKLKLPVCVPKLPDGGNRAYPSLYDEEVNSSRRDASAPRSRAEAILQHLVDAINAHRSAYASRHGVTAQKPFELPGHGLVRKLVDPLGEALGFEDPVAFAALGARQHAGAWLRLCRLETPVFAASAIADDATMEPVTLPTWLATPPPGGERPSTPTRPRPHPPSGRGWCRGLQHGRCSRGEDCRAPPQ